MDMINVGACAASHVAKPETSMRPFDHICLLEGLWGRFGAYPDC